MVGPSWNDLEARPEKVWSLLITNTLGEPSLPWTCCLVVLSLVVLEIGESSPGSIRPGEAPRSELDVRRVDYNRTLTGGGVSQCRRHENCGGRILAW